MSKFEIAANLAIFLQEKTGSVCGFWAGKISAADQRTLFGRYLGKGTVGINGAKETIRHTRKVCFGTDWECTFASSWSAL